MIGAQVAVVTKIWDKAEAADTRYLEGTPYAASATQFIDYFIKNGRQGLKADRLESCGAESAHRRQAKDPVTPPS